MNRSTLFQLLLGVGSTLVMIGALWWYQQGESQRLDMAQKAVLARQLDEAMTLYAENCAVCHGAQGEGLGATPALQRDDLRSADPESLYKIISRGLYNTAMPAWGLEDGGPLSDYQITELVNLIRYGDWQAVGQRVAQLGRMPAVPFSSQLDETLLDKVRALPQGDVLVQGLEIYAQQCVACHGEGGQGTSLAPALNAPEVREKSADEIERIIRYGVNGTLMAPWQNVLGDEEIAAVVALIQRWDELPPGVVLPPPTPAPATEETLALGEQLYAQNCAMCHGFAGQGTRRAPALNVKSYLESTNDLALEQIITNGVPGTAMPAWGTRLTQQEIQAIVAYIRSWEPTAPEVATPQRGGPRCRGGQGSPGWQRGRRGEGQSTPPAPPEAAEGSGSSLSKDALYRGLLIGGVGLVGVALVLVGFYGALKRPSLLTDLGPEA